ncbi:PHOSPHOLIPASE-RELATED [Salix purpurea]|uniref:PHOSPHOLIPASE-RELATED n=1 Tax=Salix purpurea TaxID=77065 RepID=A0A9Q0URC7_SALPP|nr:PHOSPHOLIPASE-RELATED [Salix purpurea]
MSLTPAKVSSGCGFFEGCASLRGKRWRRQRREKEAASMASRPVKFPEIDDELRKIIGANMDEVPARRLAREAFKDIQLGVDHILFKTPCDGLKMKESYEVNSRGLEIFTKSWLPKSSSPKAVVCFCHGYGDTCTFFVEGIARKLASSGYGFFAMDYPGYGLSEGLHGYIPSFDRLVDDVMEHYSKVKENPEFSTLPSFLFGESLGGAVALKVHLKQPNAWNGAILVAPMCKIADDMTPPWLLTQMLIGVANFLPKHKLVPQKDLAQAAFRDPKHRNLAAYNVIAYKDKPRLKTALEMLRTTQEIERRLEQVSLPLLILHGEADIVTDPSVSKSLYEKACSSDKKLKLYKDAFHALLEGEPDEVILQVFNDIISWLDEHSRETNSC